MLDKSPSILPLLYLIISTYGGCVAIKSIDSSLIDSNFLASPILIIIFALLCDSKSIAFFVIFIISGFISIPIKFLFKSLHSIAVVPDPTIWSSTISFSFEYLKIILRDICGAQLPLNEELCVAQSPLCGKDHTVVHSSLKSVG